MSITGSNHLLQLIIPLVKQHIKLIHNIIVKTPSSRSTGLRNLFAERENKQDIQKDVLFVLVEISGIEPRGDKRDRTADLLNAIQALSQLSYTPI